MKIGGEYQHKYASMRESIGNRVKGYLNDKSSKDYKSIGGISGEEKPKAAKSVKENKYAVKVSKDADAANSEDSVEISKSLELVNKDSALDADSTINTTRLKVLRLQRMRAQELEAINSEETNSEETKTEVTKEETVIKSFDPKEFFNNLEAKKQAEYSLMKDQYEGNTTMMSLLAGEGSANDKASRATGQYLQQLQMSRVMQQMGEKSDEGNVNFSQLFKPGF